MGNIVGSEPFCQQYSRPCHVIAEALKLVAAAIEVEEQGYIVCIRQLDRTALGSTTDDPMMENECSAFSVALARKLLELTRSELLLFSNQCRF
jgi:hypothetical protein